ncbi:MAG TPA: glutamate-5-semialdehyde dehydrogenase, partial [Candidatus Micrarchaeota archaeon]|nr:glutamate-5-semialdehyde dehydrogenase [Candidatus Micrarchaeota archaeon]
AGLIEQNAQAILSENGKEAEASAKAGLGEAFIDRLALDRKRIAGLAGTLRKIAGMDVPKEELAAWKTESGLGIRKVRVPLGVLLLIFESRPDVAVEAVALAIKSGNAIILKGGKEASGTNAAITGLLRQGAREAGLPEGAIQLFAGSRDEMKELLGMDSCIDLAVTRGGEGLARFVRESAKMPVIEGGRGNCHLYVNEDADIEMAARIAINAKVQKPSACNAIETMLVHRAIAQTFLPQAARKLSEAGVELRCCPESLAMLEGAGLGAKPANEEDWATEFSSLVLAVKIVGSGQEAIGHINKYGSRHSEAIVAKGRDAAEEFFKGIDAACVYWNASTRFSDGGQFGFGAEMCISTQKLHVRGPVGLDGLGTYKYEITGNGNIRG